MTGAVVGSCLAAASMSYGALPAQASTLGGPLVLMGIDAEDGGPGGHGPIANYVQVADAILSSTNNSGDGIAVLGANHSQVRAFWDAIGTGTGESVTYVAASAVGTQDFTGFQMVGVASDTFQTFGGLSVAENVALSGRKADIAAFINGGGGILGFSSTFSASQGGAFGYLADVGAFGVAFSSYSNITPTTEGASIGVTNSLDVCCWHNEFTTYPAFLRPLAHNPATGRVAALGGLNVVVSDIQLAPPTQTRGLADTASVTATVVENGAPVVGATVTFTVTAGPNTGTTGTAVTDSSGLATFDYAGSIAGSDSVQASFTDSSGASQSSNVVTVLWEGSNRPPSVSAGGPYTGVEGTPLNLDGTATDPDGDTLSLQWTYAAASGVDTGATCAFGSPNAEDTTFACTDDGTYHVTLTANDGNGASSDSVMAAVLDNEAPEITSVGASTADPIPVGTSITVFAPFTDAGTNDSHTCSLDWGDGATTVGTVSSGECNGTHSYSASGIHTVRVTVTDDDGASDTATYEYVVVYDPDAGFVTGGGSIASPAGAYAAEPTLGGRATFGFVSKYKKGASTPDGQTQFQFHAAGFNFHSVSYDWLVIAGARAQYKGSGTVDGVGDYGFILTAVDGQISGGGGADRFRIKIWEKSTGSVVYDNQMGDPDDSSVTTGLTGGSIVIHSKR